VGGGQSTFADIVVVTKSEGDRREREQVSQPIRSGVDGRVAGRARLQTSWKQCQWVTKSELETRVLDTLRCVDILTVRELVDLLGVEADWRRGLR